MINEGSVPVKRLQGQREVRLGGSLGTVAAEKEVDCHVCQADQAPERDIGCGFQCPVSPAILTLWIQFTLPALPCKHTTRIDLAKRERTVSGRSCTGFHFS